MTKPNIELNKLYNYFDDGKIRLSRLLKVLITDIIPFNEIDADTLELWKKEVENYDWLYSKNTDFFIKGEVQGFCKIETAYFVRTKDSDWFSIGLWGGRLDIDGKLTKQLNN